MQIRTSNVSREKRTKIYIRFKNENDSYQHSLSIYCQEKELSEYIKQLKTDFEVLKKEKLSLEQLNSTWSQKTVAQREDIDKLENSMKEAKKEMGIQSVQVKKLEGDFKNEVGN